MRTIVALVLIALPIASASGADVAALKIDELFAPYNKPHSPGCSVGVIRDGGFIYRKSYGEGSLELGTPLSSNSVFYMASTSKQFTAASIILAGEQGFLSFDDDVRKYIPELPDYGRIITLRQMLHQTSGFRDFLALTYLSGRNISALSSSDDVLKMIVRQKGLNNAPGEVFVYSNSNYFLLGVVVKRATGKSLGEFAAANIFRPLGMKKTLFYENNSAVVPNRVAAYDPGKEGGFRVDWSTIFDIVGSGGLMTNVDDLLLWDRNFYFNKLGKGTLGRELETHGTLNNGHAINYGLGLWLSEYRGLKIVEHGGGTFGYRTDLLRFPEQRFSVVVLCNIENADAEGFARRISDFYLEKQLQPVSGTQKSRAFPDPALFAGTYLDPRNHIIYAFAATNGNLMAWGHELQRLGANEFSDVAGNPIVFRNADGTMAATLTLDGEPFFSGNRVPHMEPSESALAGFAASYYSAELQATYELSLANGVLTLKYGNRSPVSLHPVAPNEFQAGDLGTIVFSVTGDRPSGLTLFSQSARGITFVRRD